MKLSAEPLVAMPPRSPSPRPSLALTRATSPRAGSPAAPTAIQSGDLGQAIDRLEQQLALLRLQAGHLGPTGAVARPQTTAALFTPWQLRQGFRAPPSARTSAPPFLDVQPHAFPEPGTPRALEPPAAPTALHAALEQLERTESAARAPREPLPFRLNQPRSAIWRTVDGRRAAVPVAANGTYAPTGRFALGSRVISSIGGQTVTGRYGGYDYKARPVIITDDGQRRVTDFATMQSLGLAPPPRSALASLRPGSVVVSPPQLRKAIETALDKPVTGTHTAREYINAFRDGGYEVFLVGGAVRDAIRLLADKQNPSEEEVLEAFNDIDIVTTAPPGEARRICEQLAPEHAGGAVFSPPFIEQFGLVLAGGKKAGLPESAGIDIACMRVGFVHDRNQQIIPDTGEKGFNATFGGDLQQDTTSRDVTCNALYYDPFRHVVVDPSLQGIADAEHGVLHIARGASTYLLNELSLSRRFWKFRERGYTTDGETVRAIRRHAEMVFNPRVRGWDRIARVNNLALGVPKDAKTDADVAKWLDGLEAAMRRDGCGDLFRRGVTPAMKQAVADRVLRRPAPAQPAPTRATAPTLPTAQPGESA